MNKKNEVLIVSISALIITCFFYKQSLGINLLIYESLLFIWLIITKQLELKSRNQLIYGIGLMITSLFTVITHSSFSYFINFLALFVFIGIIIYPNMKSLVNTMELSLSALIGSQKKFLNELFSSKFKGRNIGSYIWKSRIFLIPLIIIVVFIVIYRNSNPIFDDFVEHVNEYIQKGFNSIFKNFDFVIVITFIIGLILSNFFFLRTYNGNVIKNDIESSDELKRIRRKKYKNYKTYALKNEYKAGIFLLCILNAILLIVNVIDINWVWFDFKWEGQYLKQFVHEGTYLLILSIIISIIIVLFFFRGNLNYLKNNKFLRLLSYTWLAQNGILAISVAVRNFWYINYFSLAYKRIGVIIFLVLTIYGLYTVFVKVNRRKSSFYLFKSNSLALYVVLVVSSIINWDTLIAKYNFKHSERSFLHLDYLSTLSDKSLPYLDKPLSELSRIDTIQKAKFPFEQKFMTPEKYHQIIEGRKIAFKKEWQSKSFLSWNLSEYLAYKKLNK